MDWNRPFRTIGLLVSGQGMLIAASAADLVDIRTIDPTIKIELRYATDRNFAGRSIYPKDFAPMLERGTAKRLQEAQKMLRVRGYSLKIWDAYRPRWAQEELWKLKPDSTYVADPNSNGGSLHGWGVAVDATLVSLRTGEEVPMPTDFDCFTPAAWMFYYGKDPLVRHNLGTLQTAMSKAGFQGMRTEWWHFVDKDYEKYRPAKSVDDLVKPAPPAGAGPLAVPTPSATPAAPVAPAPSPSPVPPVRSMRPPQTSFRLPRKPRNSGYFCRRKFSLKTLAAQPLCWVKICRLA